MYILFEDNRDVAISWLLKQSDYGMYMHFACGANNLYSCVDEALQQTTDKIYVYYDVSGLPIVTERYSTFCATYTDEKRVIIFPIYGIEYFVLRLLNERIVADELEGFVSKLRIPSYIKREETSIEHMGKEVLGKIAQDCICLNPKTPIDNRGRFYVSDCPCGLNCKHKKEVGDWRLQDKANALYRHLPVYPAMPTEGDKPIDIHTTYKLILAWYTELIKALSEQGRLEGNIFWLYIKKSEDSSYEFVSLYQ